MHILHTEASEGWGGQEIRILTEAKGMEAKGHHLTIAANPNAPIIHKAKELGLDALELPLRKKNWSSIKTFKRTIRDLNPTVINTHSSVDSWVAAVARLGLDTPIVRTRHISAPIPNNFLSRWLYLKGADRVVTTGQQLCDTLRSQFAGNDNHFLSIPTGIDLDRYKPEKALNKTSARESLGIATDAVVIGIAATLRTWKGHDYLIQAFEQLAKYNEKLILLIVGDGPMGPHLKNLTSNSPYTQRIIMAGQRNDVENTMSAMDIFALPSYANEGVPQAILQAMAMRLPIISTDVGSIAEIVNANTGLLVTPKDSDTLASAISQLAADQTMRENLGTQGRDLVENKHSLAHMVDQMEAVFNQSIASRNC